MHAFMAQIMSKLKQVSAQVTKLAEEHIKKTEDILGQLGAMDTCISALEVGGKGVAEQDGANRHPQLKVSHH